MISMLLLSTAGCNSDNKEDTSPNTGTPGNAELTVKAEDGFGVIKPNEKTFINLSSYIRSPSAKISYISTDDVDCGTPEVNGQGFNVTIKGDRFCTFEYALGNGHEYSEMQILSTSAKTPILPVISKTVTLDAKPTRISLENILNEAEFIGYSIGDTIEVQGMDGNTGDASLATDEKSIEFTPPAFYGWNRIVYTLKKKEGPSILGTIFISISDRIGKAPVIVNPHIKYDPSTLVPECNDEGYVRGKCIPIKYLAATQKWYISTPSEIIYNKLNLSLTSTIPGTLSDWRDGPQGLKYILFTDDTPYAKTNQICQKYSLSKAGRGLKWSLPTKNELLKLQESALSGTKYGMANEGWMVKYHYLAKDNSGYYGVKLSNFPDPKPNPYTYLISCATNAPPPYITKNKYTLDLAQLLKIENNNDWQIISLSSPSLTIKKENIDIKDKKITFQATSEGSALIDYIIADYSNNYSSGTIEINVNHEKAVRSWKDVEFDNYAYMAPNNYSKDIYRGVQPSWDLDVGSTIESYTPGPTANIYCEDMYPGGFILSLDNAISIKSSVLTGKWPTSKSYIVANPDKGNGKYLAYDFKTGNSTNTNNNELYYKACGVSNRIQLINNFPNLESTKIDQIKPYIEIRKYPEIVNAEEIIKNIKCNTESGDSCEDKISKDHPFLLNGYSPFKNVIRYSIQSANPGSYTITYTNPNVSTDKTSIVVKVN